MQFNRAESIWQLRSAQHGLLAYAVIAEHGGGQSMQASASWHVCAPQGSQQASAVKLEAVQLSDGMLSMRWDADLRSETDTEQIHGEVEVPAPALMDEEGAVRRRVEHGGGYEPSWYQVLFGDESVYAMRRKRVTAKRLEMVGIIALTGVTAYYLWSKFGRSHPAPPVTVLRSGSGLLTPKGY